jgi:hypothetical protein
MMPTLKLLLYILYLPLLPAFSQASALGTGITFIGSEPIIGFSPFYSLGSIMPPDSASPASPSNVILTYQDNGILISWDDNSDNEDFFIIEKLIDQGTWQAWVTYAQVEENITSYLDLNTADEGQCIYRVRAFGSNVNAMPSNASDWVGISCNQSLGVEESTEAHFNLWPNPAGEDIFISSNGGLGLLVHVYDMSGREVLNTPLQSDKQTFSIGHLPAGLYTVAVTMHDGSIVRQRLMKQ